MKFKLKSLFINLIVLFVSIIISLILAELLSKVFFPQPLGLFIHDEQLGFKLQPNYMGWHAKLGFRVKIETNKYGMRNREIGEKINGNIRILGLGDSNPYGWGVGNDESCLSLLENALNNSFDNRIEMINAAVPAYCTFHSGKLLTLYGDSLKIDIALLFITPENDLSENETFYEGRFKLVEKNNFFTKLEKSSVLYYIIHRLYKRYNNDNSNSTAIQVEHRLHMARDLMNKRISITCELIAQANDAAKKSGVELVVILPPNRHWVLSPNLYTDIVSQTILDAISKLSKEKGFQLIILTDDFKQYTKPENLYLKKDMHWSPTCHVFLSDLLMKYLKDTVADRLAQVSF